MQYAWTGTSCHRPQRIKLGALVSACEKDSGVNQKKIPTGQRWDNLVAKRITVMN